MPPKKRSRVSTTSTATQPNKRSRVAQQLPTPLTAAAPPVTPPVQFPLGDNLINAMLLTVDPKRKIDKRTRKIKSVAGLIEKARLAAQKDATKKTAYETDIRSNPTFQEIEAKYAQLPPLEQQLANLTSEGLVNLEATGRRLAPLGGDPVNYGTLESVDLLKTPYRIPKSRPPMNMDFYDSDDRSPTFQRIVFSPNTGAANPITAFIHEGRHALDDLYKRPHQRETINFLKEEEERNRGYSIDYWLQPLLEGAQKIIDSPSFSRDYPYTGTDSFKEKIDKNFKNLNKSKTFSQAKKALTKDRRDGKDSGDAFMGLSEFPAFMTEQLDKTFQGPNTPGIYDPSRRFIKENLRTMYRDYDELSRTNGGNGLGIDYPLVHQAFFDRYNELRNPNRVVSLEPTQQANSLLKMGAAPVPLGSPPSALPILPQNMLPVSKMPLAYTDPFPAPKYTNRAQGGHIKTKNPKRGLSDYLNGMNKKINFINVY